MESTSHYGQMDFNLPHDVVKLPTRGMFYKPKKESLKVGYLTAADENLLLSSNESKDGLIISLLRNKIYEPGFDVNKLLESDVQALLIFLRNTSFGPEYLYSLQDPVTKKYFDVTISLEALNFKPIIHQPDENGHFEFLLPKSNKKVKCKLLTVGDTNEIEKSLSSYPSGMVAPVITKKLEKHIISLDGDSDGTKIVTFIQKMPISDSKQLRKFLSECEPKLDLTQTIMAPSGEKVTFDVTFGVEFFRPFFSV